MFPVDPVMQQTFADNVWLHFFQMGHSSSTGARPTILVRGEGSRVWDQDGTQYIDALAGLFCVNAGYGRREIVDAVAAQLTDISFVSPFSFPSVPQIKLAGELARISPMGSKTRTFFVTGGWVETFPDAARAIVRDGHEIGNHSLTHPFFSQIGLDGAAAELEETEKIIKATTGITSRPYFRFPYGDSTPDTAGVVASEGYVAYHWSADDGSIPYWLSQIAANPADGYGGILLMHGRYSTVDELPGWLDRLASIGLQPTTLGEVLK